MPDERFGGLPELTASLRALGSRRRTRHGAAVQPRFFALLLDARKAAARGKTSGDVVAAFDGAAILHSMESMIRDVAAERFPSRPPARRAFEAELTETIEPLRAALTRLRALGPAAAAESADTQANDAWERWLDQLRAMFAAADAVWPAVDAALEHRAPVPDTRRGR